jgi:hypothetical protein
MKVGGEYGNGYSVSDQVAKTTMKGAVKNNIPVAQTNKTGANNKFDGGKMNGVAYVHDRQCYQNTKGSMGGY